MRYCRRSLRHFGICLASTSVSAKLYRDNSDNNRNKKTHRLSQHLTDTVLQDSHLSYSKCDDRILDYGSAPCNHVLLESDILSFRIIL